MAPEQAGGKKKESGPAADVYTLGAILYEGLTGRPPFRAATLLETLLKVTSVPPVPPRKLRATTPADLETICLKCLGKEPAKRYASAAVLAADLRRWLPGQPTPAPRAVWPSAAAQPLRPPPHPPAHAARGRLDPDRPRPAISLSAYAAASDRGRAPFVRQPARIDDPKPFLPFQEILDAVKACPVKKRILLLDLVQPCTAPGGGLLANDVAERLQPLLEEAVRDDADLPILTAPLLGQVSLSSEKLSHPVLAP